MSLRLTICHENALSPLGGRVTRDGAFVSWRGSGEGVQARYFHGSEGSVQRIVRPGPTELRGSFASLRMTALAFLSVCSEGLFCSGAL